MKNSLRILVLLLSTMFIAACGGSGGQESVDIPLVGVDGEIQSKAYLEESSAEEIKPHISECGHKRLCVKICHRPPGNPANAKTKCLPLSATYAHLRHGSGHHVHRDYLGPCEGGNDDSDDGEDNDGSGGGDDGSDDGSDDGEVSTGEPPLWCQPYIEVDADCDGYIDENGEPYL